MNQLEEVTIFLFYSVLSFSLLKLCNKIIFTKMTRALFIVLSLAAIAAIARASGDPTTRLIGVQDLSTSLSKLCIFTKIMVKPFLIVQLFMNPLQLLPPLTR